MTALAAEQPRVSKRDFIARVAVRSSLSSRLVNAVYEALVTELKAAAVDGETVVLTGFGRFYRQTHKGHKVRFGREDVDDYPVLKFSASSCVNRRLERGEAVDLTGPEFYGMLEDVEGMALDYELKAVS